MRLWGYQVVGLDRTAWNADGGGAGGARAAHRLVWGLRSGFTVYSLFIYCYLLIRFTIYSSIYYPFIHYYLFIRFIVYEFVWCYRLFIRYLRRRGSGSASITWGLRCIISSLLFILSIHLLSSIHSAHYLFIYFFITYHLSLFIHSGHHLSIYLLLSFICLSFRGAGGVGHRIACFAVCG